MNPLNKSYYQRLASINKLQEEESKEIDLPRVSQEIRYIKSTAESISIIGISGIGKTTAIQSLLMMYPQVIQHYEYKVQPFSRAQIVWLKIDCPYDGNLSTLFKSWFGIIVILIYTSIINYYLK